MGEQIQSPLCGIVPEGVLIHRPSNRGYISSYAGLTRAMAEYQTCEAVAVSCDSEHNLHIDLGFARGIIPREEASLPPSPSAEIKDIAVLSRVGKPTCFKVIDITEDRITLSRRAAQKEACTRMMSSLIPGDIVSGRITHLSSFGAFVDVGCGIAAMIGIENISVSRISHPSDMFYNGQNIFAAVLAVDRELRRIVLTHKELLGSWEQNARRFCPGETVEGVVRGVLDYGVFVELTPNLSGLAEYTDDVLPGQHVSVFIKSISCERMKIKLVIIEKLPAFVSRKRPMPYFITSGRLSHWRYAPDFSRTGKTTGETMF